jgi:CheY-like chemotaxis protein
MPEKVISNPKPQPKILIVDDLALNLQILAQALSSYYQMITAINGADALNIAVQEQPDLILLDVMMPDMSGFDVCRQLKANADNF